MNKTEQQCQMEILEMNIKYCEKRVAEYCNLAFATGNRSFFFKAGCYIDLIKQKAMELDQLQKQETRIFGRKPNGFKCY